MIDGGPNTNSMLLPFGTFIAPHGFLVVFPSSNTPIFHNTETYLRRLLINGVVIDQVTLPMLGTDQSYARIPDGALVWQVTGTPTIGTSNDPASPLPTPSITPAPTRIPKHHPTKGSATGSATGGTNQKATKNRASNTIDTTTNDTAGQPATADGTQPAWGYLQLPPGSSSSPEATTSANTSDSTTATSPPSTADNADLPRKVLLTSLAVVLACVLFLCWRRFKPT
jgi:hypothetical protein